MALRTKQELVDEIIMETYSGIPTVERSISDNFVLRKVNNLIAAAAMKSLQPGYDCNCIDDIFYLTATGITLLADSVLGLQYFTLPLQPIGLPDRTAIIVSPPANRGGVRNGIFKPIKRREVTLVRSLPRIRKVFHYTENGREYFIDEFGIIETYPSINLTIASSGANDLTAFVNMPDDMIGIIKAQAIADLRNMLQLQDTTPLPPADAPQVR